jgi:hypothetical protein
MQMFKSKNAILEDTSTQCELEKMHWCKMRYDASLNLFSIGIYMFEIQKNLKKLQIKATLVIINTFDNLFSSLWLF